MPDNPEFTHNVRSVCYYCKHFGFYVPKQMEVEEDLCSIQTDGDGRYLKLVSYDEEEKINQLNGCQDFEPSGMPAHPSVIDELVRNNSKARNIPVDQDATETGHKFDSKKYDHAVPLHTRKKQPT